MKFIKNFFHFQVSIRRKQKVQANLVMRLNDVNSYRTTYKTKHQHSESITYEMGQKRNHEKLQTENSTLKSRLCFTLITSAPLPDLILTLPDDYHIYPSHPAPFISLHIHHSFL